MTKGRNLDNFGASTLPDAFSDLNSETLQVMAGNLMQALQEAQGLLTDSLDGGLNLQMPAPSQADPFGGQDVQAKIGAALIRNPEKSGHAMSLAVRVRQAVTQNHVAAAFAMDAPTQTRGPAQTLEKVAVRRQHSGV